MKRGLLKREKAQVSVFIIIAIAILAFVGIIFLIYNKEDVIFEKLSFDKQSEFLTDSALDCFEGVYKNSLDTVGMQGGYSSEPLSEYIITNDYFLPFYYFNGLNFVPFRELIEEELSTEIDFGKQECFDLISDFNIGYDFSYNLPNISIQDDKVTFLTNLVLVLTRGEDSITVDFKEYPIEVASNIGEMSDFASYITYSYYANNESLCTNCFAEIAEERDFLVEFLDDFDGITSVNIVDNNTDNSPNVYRFLMSNFPIDTINPIILEDSLKEVDESEEISVNVPTAK